MGQVRVRVEVRVRVRVTVRVRRYCDRVEACAWQGQEVCISYGQQSNDRLLQYYGFVEQRNPADTYVMTSMPERLQVRSRCHRASN